jgi:hypothetical protein
LVGGRILVKRGPLNERFLKKSPWFGLSEFGFEKAFDSQVIENQREKAKTSEILNRSKLTKIFLVKVH